MRFRQAVSTDNTGSGTSLTLTLDQAITEGSGLLAFFYYNNANGGTYGCSDPNGGAWIPLDEHLYFAGESQGLRVFYYPKHPGGSTQVIFTNSQAATFRGAAVWEASEVEIDRLLLFDLSFQREATPGTGTDVVDSGNISAPSDQRYIIVGLTHQFLNTVAPTPGTNFTQRETGWAMGTGLATMMIEDRVVQPSGALATVQAVFSTTSNTAHYTVGVVLRDAIGPPGLAAEPDDLADDTDDFRAELSASGWFDAEIVSEKWFDDDLEPETGIVGNLARTLEDLTLDSAGEVTIVGSLARTLADVTLDSDGDVNPITGTLARTLEDVTLDSDGGVTVVGTLARTLEDLTLDSDGAVTVIGTLARTLEDLTLDSDGAVTVIGTLARTLEDLTLDSDGTVGADVTGTLSQTLADLTLSSSGTVAGGAAVEEPGGGPGLGRRRRRARTRIRFTDSIVRLRIEGRLDRRLDDVVLRSRARAANIARAAIQLEGMTLRAVGSVNWESAIRDDEEFFFFAPRLGGKK